MNKNVNNYNNLKSWGTLMIHGVSAHTTKSIHDSMKWNWYLVSAAKFWLQEIDNLAYFDVCGTSIR